MKFPVRLLLTTISVIVTAFILPGISSETFLAALAAAVALALLITSTKRIFLSLKIPMNMIFFGFILFTLITLLTLLISELIPGFSVNSVWHAIIFSIILTGITSVINSSVASTDSYHH